MSQALHARGGVPVCDVDPLPPAGSLSDNAGDTGGSAKVADVMGEDRDVGGNTSGVSGVLLLEAPASVCGYIGGSSCAYALVATLATDADPPVAGCAYGARERSCAKALADAVDISCMQGELPSRRSCA